MRWLRFFGLVMLLACGLGMAWAQNPRDITCLYYFESDDADLRQADSKTYAFATLPNEKVSLVVYGLDGRLQPRVTLRSRSGEPVASSAARQEQAHIVVYEFTATRNELYFVEITRAPDERGFVRFMLFANEPLNQDITLLDNINPLLPSRAFIVAGRDEAEGLRARVETLIVPRFRQRPMVFASRGAFGELPPREERQQPAEIVEWFNTDGRRVYTINVRATPEDDLALASAANFRLLNVGNGFYFDYYLIIGAGSDPVQLVREDDCAAFPNREACILASSTLGREPLEDFRPAPVTESDEGEPDVQPTPDPFEIDPVPCPDGIGIISTLSAPGVLVGSDCPDILGGSAGDDLIRGAGDGDLIRGNDGKDQLYGEDGNDFIDGGAGADELYGGAGNDTLDGGPGNDLVDGGDGFDLATYENHLASVNVNLSTGLATDGYGDTDTLVSIEGVIGSQFDDTLIGDVNSNILYGLGGDDTLNAGGGAGQQVYGGAGNDTFLILDDQTISVFGGDNATDPNSGNDTFIFGAGVQAQVRFLDSSGRDTLDFSALSGPASFNGANSSPQNVTPDLILSLPQALLNSSTQVLDILGTTFNDVLGGTNRNIAGQDDRIYAGAGDDLLLGSLGDDLLDGGTGNDTVSYANHSTIINANLATGTTLKGGTQDTLVNIENLIGTAFSDTLIGDGGANILSGLGGDDFINGGAGDDILLGGDGVDILLGSAGDDLIEGGAGGDLINGGAGNDTASYVSATSGVNVDLTAGTASGGAGSDTLVSIENIIGSAYDDTLRGDANDNRIDGGAGNDTVIVTAGDDTASGGAQTFLVGSNALTQEGWGDLLDASAFNVPITVTITGTSGTLSHAGHTTTFNGFERVYTGAGADTFNLSGALSPLAATPLSPTEWLTVGDQPGALAGPNTFNFSDVSAGTTGYVQINNSASDQVFFDAVFNLNPNNTTDWQEVAPDLFIRLLNPLNPACPPGTGNHFVFNNFFAGDLWNTFGNCPTNDFYNGSQFYLSPFFATLYTDTVSYNGNGTLGQVDLGDDDWLDYNVGAGGTPNLIVVQRVGGPSIGTDELRNVERVIGTSTGEDIFHFNDLAGAWGDPVQPRPLILNGLGWDASSNRMDTLDFTNVSSSVVVDLKTPSASTKTPIQASLDSAPGHLQHHLRHAPGR